MSEYYQGRAKQFLPYAALRGFDEMVNEKHRITEEKQEFFEDVERIISERISLIKTGRDVTVRVFNKGERYTIKGIVKGVDFAVSTLTVGKHTLHFCEICDLYFNDEGGELSIPAASL